MAAAGLYAEAAHIRGLGTPHYGPDSIDNILCLCPNHHVLFDNGGIYIDDTEVVRVAGTDEIVGQLRNVPRHKVNPEHIRYHRDHYVAI